MERLTAAEAVTADGRRWLITHSVHQPTSTLIEEVFSNDGERWVLAASYASEDRDASRAFWTQSPLISHSQLPEVPGNLPAPELADSIRLRTTPRTQTWFASDEG
ncbi:hypothetical protein [Microbacterium kyungheense]|uniref:Uncharacterized protein n=1 Tax=Microbacterium kyungheense TaxID=1263636 RepID=A0A543F3J6_9MICO|nr:hypothetical protein [Microbacterium kyungheense]TQM28399.1 hypothetical protein FB391_2466 [Microbacterium kyungheense]